MVDYINDLNLLSPGSDALYGTQSEQVVLGRDGGDSVILYDPKGDPDLPQSDVTVLDIVAGELPGERIPRDWTDIISLGDWNQPFYVNSQSNNSGLGEALYILNFQPELDIIRLHGTPENYEIVDTPIGQALFWIPGGDASSDDYWQQKEVSDLIALFLETPDLIDAGISPLPPLSLDESYFNFLGFTPPEPVNPKIQQLGTDGHDVTISPAVATATDPDGNVYIVSGTTGSFEGETNAGSFDTWVAKYSKEGELLWTQQYGTSGLELTPRIATDQEGNFYLSGYTTGDFGAVNQGVQDAYVAKYDSDGNQIWIQQFGTPLIDAAFGLDVDEAGNVYLSGLVGKLVPVEGEEDLTFAEDTWVAKFDSDGNQLFFTEYGSSGVGSEESYGAAVDNEGNLLATGWTLGEDDQIDPSLSERLGTYDVWLSSTDATGEVQWINQFGTSDYEFSWAVDTDSQGNVYATGHTLGDIGTFGQGNFGLFDTWLAKFDNLGNQQWILQLGTEGDEAALDVHIDEFDNIFLTGYTDSDFGGENAGFFDAWVARLDTDGNQLWLQQFGSSEVDHGTHLSTDGNGNLYVAGLTEGSLGTANQGTVDAWLAKLDIETGTILPFQSEAIVSDNPDEFINQLDSSDNYLVFTGGTSNRDFNGNGGDDTFFLGEGSQRANMGNGNDTVFAGGGDDIIRDNGGVNNQLFGDNGDDLIVANSGGGIINGGAGFDTIEINGAQGYTVQLELDANSDTDTFDTIRNVNEQTLRDGKVTFDILGVDSPDVTFERLGNGTKVSFNGDDLLFIDNIQPSQFENLNNAQNIFV